MVEIRALPGRERLMMVFKGQVTEEELVQAEQELRGELPRISPTFDMTFGDFINRLKRAFGLQRK